MINEESVKLDGLTAKNQPTPTGLAAFWVELKRRKVSLVANIFDRLRGNPRFDALLED